MFGLFPGNCPGFSPEKTYSPSPDPTRLALAISGAYTEAEKSPWWSAGKDTYFAESRERELLAEEGRKKYGPSRILRQGDPSRKWIALTFDDGPHPGTTPQLLSILKKYNAKATFFLVGMMAEAHPDLVLEESRAGHLIANHTYHHVNLLKIPEKYIGVELETCSLILEDITGKKPRFFRPPGGNYSPAVRKIAGGLGYTTVLWTNNPGDWAGAGNRSVEAKLMRRLSRGGIILLHDGVQGTLEILPKILSSLKRQGYSFVTVDEYLKVL
ncbi:MAG: polysaccharide deacetylase family protein [Synergistaceae bacterium]|nr:polysaccharide deacetylase family protein [Synergistaceae bacterium]